MTHRSELQYTVDLALAVFVSALVSFCTGIILAIIAGGVLLWLI